jgi:hypothetical protein
MRPDAKLTARRKRCSRARKRIQAAMERTIQPSEDACQHRSDNLRGKSSWITVKPTKVNLQRAAGGHNSEVGQILGV